MYALLTVQKHLTIDYNEQTSQFSNIFLSQFVGFASVTTLNSTYNRRVFIVHSRSALLSQNYWCHVTSTLYKVDTSLKRTVGAGPDGVRLRESWLYNFEILVKLCQTVVENRIKD